MLRTVKFGRKIRNLYNEAVKSTKAGYECPKCGKVGKMKRESYSIWLCKSCGAIMAGGAYSLNTEAGETIKRIISTLHKK
ncbi:MAG: hypothetical protein NTY68_02075 [Candidatus Micrarchaeota archaeon]|jgi:large subunit ribosomal protein L37Ae|nr:hypothetical protein [Candidatus Micrarchaeota archaeon]